MDAFSSILFIWGSKIVSRTFDSFLTGFGMRCKLQKVLFHCSKTYIFTNPTYCFWGNFLVSFGSLLGGFARTLRVSLRFLGVLILIYFFRIFRVGPWKAQDGKLTWVTTQMLSFGARGGPQVNEILPLNQTPQPDGPLKPADMDLNVQRWPM